MLKRFILNLEVAICYLLQINYELYGKFENKNLSFTSKKALAFAGSLKDAYVGVENPLFIVLKIAVCMQNLSQDENYDFTDYWTDSLATGLWNLLKELNVAHDYQTVYTINALLSGFEMHQKVMFHGHNGLDFLI